MPPTQDPVTVVSARIAELAAHRDRPLIVAIDGRSGTGKSTLVAAVTERTGAVIVDGDSFYGGGTAEEWDAMSPSQRADHCIDWRRQRPVLGALAEGNDASWSGYDWDAFDGTLLDAPLTCAAAPIVIVDGAYSGRPELADLVDLRVLLEVDEQIRRTQLLDREGDDFDAEWDARWRSAEDHYFGHVMPRAAFDLVVTRH